MRGLRAGTRVGSGSAPRLGEGDHSPRSWIVRAQSPSRRRVIGRRRCAHSITEISRNGVIEISRSRSRHGLAQEVTGTRG